ncbi:alanine racemase, partial [bacterium]|nr:alanine racemase [bacterium]
MQQLADEAAVALRPHWKTHKCVEIARLQIDGGAVGGTVAKTSEAESYFAAGFDDVLVATPVVARAKIERLLRARGAGTLAVLIESEEGLRRWTEQAGAA